MGESTKSACALMMIIGGGVAAFAWSEDHPDTTTWMFRIISLLFLSLPLLVILKLHFRTDLVEDHLKRLFGTYFNRDGFCFSISARPVDGIAYLEAHFQNQYDKPSIGKIAVRPARGFWMNRANLEMITFKIECAPAAFGVVRMPIPIPIELQGKRLSFEVGASVEYPQGKGRRLRFHDGLFLRTNASFGKAFETALTVAGAAGGMIVLTKPASVKIDLPAAVAENIPFDSTPELTTIFTLDDAAICNVA